MILHLVTDEKFTDYAINQFADKESKFVLIPVENELQLVSQINKVDIVYYNTIDFENLLLSLSKYKAVVFHGMHWSYWQTKILNCVPNNVKVAWVIWGGDVLARSDVEDNFYALFTRCLNYLYVIKKKLKRKINVSPEWELSAALFSKIDYCLTSQLELFDYTQWHFKRNFKYLWYTYFNIEEIIGTLYNSTIKGENIWLGNSATATNNHVDTLLKLYKYKKYIKDKKIYMPLSYPNTWIRNVAISLGKFLFKDSIKPLLLFLNREEYNSLMLNCSVMIMPHYMSQAMGNIFTGLWLGMRVYMSKRNLSFNYLKRIGIYVFSIEDDLDKYKFSKLSEEEIKINRCILIKEYGKSHIEDSVNNIIKELDK